MSFDVDKFGKKSGIELNTLNAGMKKTDIEEKNKVGKSIFDAIDTDGNGVIDEKEISMFRKEIDSDNDNTISKKEAKRFLKDNELKDVDKKEVLKFLAEMNNDTKDVNEVKVIEQDGKKIVQVSYKDGSYDLINDDESYSHTTTDENGNQITEEYNSNKTLERKTTQTPNNNTTVTEYEQDGQTIKQKTTTTSQTGETTIINYENGKPVSKDVKKGVATTHYEIDEAGNEQKKSQVINDGDSEKQKVTTYETNEDGTITATTTDALNPNKKTVKTIVKNGDSETVAKEVITDGDTTIERTYTEKGIHEVTTTPNGKTETDYNKENNRISQKKTVDGKEYTVEYDGNGNTKVILQNGESVDALAKKFGTTKEKVLEANGGKIRGWAGDEVVVPGELEADDKRLQGRQTAEEAKAAYKVVAEEIERVNKEASERKTITFTEKKHKTFEELARGLFKNEGVENPTKRELEKRIKQLKEANPDVKDGELIGKRIKAPVDKEVHNRIAQKEKEAKQKIEEKKKAQENTKLQKESAKQITEELIKATKGWNDEEAIKTALNKIDNPEELKEVERLLAAQGYKADQYYSALEKFMSKEMSGSKMYDKSFDDMEEIVQKWISNGALTGEDAINAQARLAARLIIDGCDGLGTDVDETKEGIKYIKSPTITGDKATDKANAKKVYDKVNEIIKNHSSFGAKFKDLKDYLSGDLWDSEIKYLDGILAENNALQGEEKAKAVKDLVQEAVEYAGTDIEYLKQAIKAIDSPEDRAAIEKELKEYCEKKGIKPQIEGQSYLQAILYDECDTFLGVSTDHKEIRKFNEMLIKQGAYTPEEATKLRAEQAALQIIEGDFDEIQDAVKQIKDPEVLAQLNNLLKTKNFKDIETLITEKGYSQTQKDVIMAELASNKLLDSNKAAEIATRLLQNPDFDTRAMGFKAITTGEIANIVSEALKAKGQNLAAITEQFNKEKAENKEKAAFWDNIAMAMGGFTPLGYIAEHISDEYNENTETSNNLYVENPKPIELTQEQQAAYDMTVKTFEEQLNQMKKDYQEALDSQGVVSGALNAFCSVYNIGTTRDDIEARIKHDEETLKLLKLAADGKLAKVENGKTTAVTFEEVFKERASEFITANGSSISAIKNKKNPKEVTEFSVEKVEKVAKKAQTIVAMDYAKDNIAICWNELNKGLNSKDNKELSVAICDTMEKLSQMSGQTMTLDAFGYKVSNGVIVDASGNPVSADKLSEISAQLKKGLSEISEYLLGTSIPADATDADLKDILNDAYEDKMEAFKQEYREAFGQQATDEMIENYMKTINYSKMAVNFGLLIGATIAAPFTGGGSLAVFAATAGVSFGMNALEKSTDADGYTNSEWTSDAEQALWDGALTAIGFKVGQMADMAATGGEGFLKAMRESNKWIAQITKNLPPEKLAKVEQTMAKLSQLTNTKAAKISQEMMAKNNALALKYLPNANVETIKKVSACISRVEATGVEVTSDTIQSLIQTYCQDGEFNAEGFTQALIMSVIGNAAGHTFSAIGDIKQQISTQTKVDALGQLKGADGKNIFSPEEINDLVKNNPGFQNITKEQLKSLQDKVNILGQLKDANGNLLYTPTEINKFIKNNPQIMNYTLDQIKDLNNKINYLSTLKAPNGKELFPADVLKYILDNNSANLNNLPTETLKILTQKSYADYGLITILGKIESADDIKVIDKLISIENKTNCKFEFAGLEDILDSKHSSQLNDFEAFVDEIINLDHTKGQLIANPNIADNITTILHNVQTETQKQAFDKLKVLVDNEIVSYSHIAERVKSIKTEQDLTVLDKLLERAQKPKNIDEIKDNLKEIEAIYRKQSANSIILSKEDMDFSKEILNLLANNDKVKLSRIANHLTPAVNLKFNDLDKNLIIKYATSGDIEKLEFALSTKKEFYLQDTPLMRYINKTGNVPYDAAELQNIKTNSPLQENAFELLLNTNKDSRFEASAFQDIIYNIKTQQDLDNLQKLLSMEVNGKPLDGYTIIENLKAKNIDADIIARQNPAKGISYTTEDINNLASKYGISSGNAYGLLRLRSANAKRYNKIIDSGLLDLIKQGKIDESILKNIDENTFLSNRTLKDIRKIANGESLITTLRNPSELSNISKYVENGDVCELNGKLFVNDNGKAVEIKLSRQKFEELFPPLSRVSFEQDGLGDCWLVSTLDNLMDIAGGRVALYKLFEQQGNDILIKFPGSNNAIKFPNSKALKTPTRKQLASPAQKAKGRSNAEGTAEGILILEQAFAVHRLKEGARAYDVNSSITDISQFTDIDDLMKRIKGGWQEEALNEIFGTRITIDHYGTDIANRQKMKDLIKQYANDDQVLLYFATRSEDSQVEQLLSDKYDIYSNHAYAIKGYDEKTGMVYITNPWHTSVVTEVPLYELTKYLVDCSFAKLDGIKPKPTFSQTPTNVSSPIKGALSNTSGNKALDKAMVSSKALKDSDLEKIRKYAKLIKSKTPQQVEDVFESLALRIKNNEIPSSEMFNQVINDVATKSGIDAGILAKDIRNLMKNIDGWDKLLDPFKKSADINANNPRLAKDLDKFKTKYDLQSDTRKAELQAEAELKAKQDAELKAQQEAELKAQQEAALKAQQDAELRAQQEAQQNQQILETYKDKYPEVINEKNFRDDTTPAKLITLMEQYNLNMDYSNFNPQEIYQEISRAGITNDADMDIAFNMIKERFHSDIISTEAHVKTMNAKYHFTSKKSVLQADNIIEKLKAKQANGEPISEDDIENMIASLDDYDVRDGARIKQMIMDDSAIKAEINPYENIYKNPKFNNIAKEDLDDAVKILTYLKNEVQNGNPPTLEMVRYYIDHLATIKQANGNSLSTEAVWVLQDTLRYDTDLAPKCKGFVENIIQGGFEPEPSQTFKNLSANSKYTDFADETRLTQVANIIDELKADAANGTPITEALVQSKLDALNNQLEKQGSFVSTEQYWILQDALRYDAELAPKCKGFVENIIQGGFEPEPSQTFKNLLANSKYTDFADETRLSQVADIIDELKADAANGTPITEELVRAKIDALDDELRKQGGFVSTEQYWVLQDALRYDNELAPKCKNFVENIIQGGFEPEPSQTFKNLLANSKYTNLTDETRIAQVANIIDDLKADAANGTPITEELVRAKIDALDDELSKQGSFVSTDQYYILQDALRYDNELAQKCKNFVENIIQGGFEPEHSQILRNTSATQEVTSKKYQSRAAEASPSTETTTPAKSSKGLFSRFKKFTKSIFEKSETNILTSTKVSDKMSAISNITDMYGKPKFSETELENINNALIQYEKLGHQIKDLPLNTIYAAANVPGVTTADQLTSLLVSCTDTDKKEILNSLIRTKDITINNGILNLPKVAGSPDFYFITTLIEFVQDTQNYTAKVQLLEKIMDPNGPIRPTLQKLDNKTAYEIAGILNMAQSEQDVTDILSYIKKFQQANGEDTKLSLNNLYDYNL